MLRISKSNKNLFRVLKLDNYCSISPKRWAHSDDKCPAPKPDRCGECVSHPLIPEGNFNAIPCPKPREELFDINCKTVVVVGGEQGIGYAAAHELLCKKAKVVGIFGKNVCKGMEACQSLNCMFGQKKAVFLRVDATTSTDMECAICRLTNDYGRIEAFVNAFAICDGKNWANELETNVIGTARSTILAHQYLAENKSGGVIINTAGIFGFLASAGCPITSASQHAIIGLTRSFGHEKLYKQSHVRVVTFCPGITKSGLFRKAENRALTSFMGKCLKEEIEKMKKQRAETCGAAISFLIRHAHSGTVWLLDGGDLFIIHRKKSPHCCSELYHQFTP